MKGNLKTNIWQKSKMALLRMCSNNMQQNNNIFGFEATVASKPCLVIHIE